MRGSSSNPGDCQWPRPPGRAEIPVDRESHGIRLVEGIGCARFQVAGKSPGGFLPAGPARRDRPDGLRTRRAPAARRKPERTARPGGWRGKRPGLARVCGSPAARRPRYRPGQKTAGAGRPGHAEQQGRRCCTAGTGPRHDPLRPACATAGGRRRPAVRRGPGRPPAPLTAAATCPGLVSRSRAPDGSGARQGGPVMLRPGPKPPAHVQVRLGVLPPGGLH
jgi:hypothetical protein